MDTELLKTFLEVSRTRHFGRAAESLYLTQSAVSFRIRQLENQLGANLFTRHRNNIRLTPAGERLLPYAESLMNTAVGEEGGRAFAATHRVVDWRYRFAVGGLSDPGCRRSINNARRYSSKRGGIKALFGKTTA